MKRNFVQYLLLSLALFPGKGVAAEAQIAIQAEIAAIDTLCGEAKAVAKKQGKPRLFGNTTSMEAGSSDEWRQFPSAQARDKAATDANLFETADVTMKDGKVIAVSFMFSSPSGDWAHYVDACYRKDGSLARADTDLRTFHGNIRIVRNIHLSPTGNEIKRKTSYFDLDTGRKKNSPKPDEFLDQDPPIFLQVRDLPFIKFLKE